MKLVIIALAAVLVLGGGAGAYFFLINPAEASGAPMGEHEKAEMEAAKKAEEEARAKAEKDNVSFVKIDPLILPIIDGNGVSQVVSIVIAIEIPAAIETSSVKRLSPRLKDAYIQDMYGMLNRKASMSGGVIEVQQLKARLTKVTKHILGDDIVNDVLLQVVQQRPI